MKIGYYSLGESAFQYGLNLCLESLRLRGYEPVSVDPEEAKTCDVVLVSFYWWEHYYDFLRFLAIAEIDPAERKPLVIVGGMNITLNPVPISNFFHYAVIGDGEESLPLLIAAIEDGKDPCGIPGVWDPRSSHRVEMQNVPTMTLSPFVEQRTNPVTRIEIARGCKSRCKFCAISHIKPYRELPLSSIIRGTRESKTKTIGLFAPDRSSHSAFGEIVEFVRNSRHNDICSDIRLDHIDKVKRVGRVRFGIEGMSERLRHAVGKRMSDEMICEKMDALVKCPSFLKDHHTTCDTYFILDLPGEEISDYHALGTLLDKLCSVLPSNFMWSIIPNIFSPNPQTGLQWARITLRTDFMNRWRHITSGSNRGKRSFVIGSKTPGGQPGQRVKAQLVYRGTAAAGKIIWNLTCNPKFQHLRRFNGPEVAKAILKMANAVGLSEDYLIGEIPVDDPLPWDFIENPTASKESLVQEWERYKRILSLTPELTADAS